MPSQLHEARLLSFGCRPRFRMSRLKSKEYSDSFYRDRNVATRHSARVILSMVLTWFPGLRSAVDLGCGVGAWLAAANELGIQEVLGVDGRWVNQQLLEIPRESFRVADLDASISLSKKYDLAISLEVAEHLPADCAAGFVDSLVQAADVVLFSAAIPRQGGKNHYNEQWPAYWAGLFQAHGYVAVDVIRPRIWNDDAIPFWYRQNVMLFVRNEVLTQEQRSLFWQSGVPDPSPLSLVHPELYSRKIAETLKAGWMHFRRSVRASIRRSETRRSET